ncbi:TM0106 family RecB-like putative nuclease [Ornithinimicrobium pekingense]|uniref:Nuclease n=1 Tax=Ornithinimicrobium pekingense TaxID=384677 RepID=A0ABQ2F6Y7_9MICO|nr:TM0106 family RecB-like putative nuclease [Ornithinimicrobium pekingense]GGK68058.1 nuclease [Ornithinimicrobium pekingense]
MFLHDDRLVLSATDVTRHVGCAHATSLEREVAAGRREAPVTQDVGMQLVTAMGQEHEEAYLRRLRDEGRRVVEVARAGSWAERERLTLEAMHAGADVVYQATLFDGSWLGHADFLLRAERPSRLGGWSYDIADTKLARHLSVDALLQMAGYAARLEQLQGTPARRLTVVAGDGREHHWRPADVMAYARRMRSRLVGFLASGDETEPAPSAACGRCRWIEHCTDHWDEVDDLSRVAGLRGDHREALREHGITTVAALAAAGPEELHGVLSSRVRDRLHGQARLQVQERETGEAAYELLPPETGRGLQLLPEPDVGDVYLDFEGDPFADGGVGREYLAGIWTRDGDYLDWWAHDPAEEARLTGDLLGWLLERWRRHPGMHVYHYAAYEVTALKRMTGQHATGESGLDQLLRGGRFVDLYQVVRQGVRLSKPSYSIKKVEDFYWHRTRTAAEGEVADGMASVVEYERWLAEGRTDDGVLQALRRYNREDVRSTHALHEWLEGLRAELATAHPGVELTRPAPSEVVEARDSERMLAEQRLAQRLADDGQTLLAGLVGWHRREDKPRWWDYYRTETMSVEELMEDGRAIGAVGPPVAVGTEKRSTVWQYDFPPQDAVMTGVGDAVVDARTHETVGTLVGLDAEAGWVRVKRGTGREPLRPDALVQKEVLSSGPLQDSLSRLGAAALDGGEELGLRLVARTTPVIPARETAETAGDLMRRVGRGLDGEVLAVQGPPGAGKSYNGALLVRDLLDAGKRVGVTAQSHRVIADLMDNVGRPGVRKGSGRGVPAAEDATVRVVTDNGSVDEAVAEGVTFLGGTAWLWAREEMRQAVDVLVVDEAGQFSLANAAAVAQGARSMVLLGDPQQLRSPTQATHPWGAGVSALEHLLDGHETIDPARGVFLDRTWRMHPRITDFVSELAYEGRLGADRCTEGQVVDAPGRLTGAGLRWVPVPHVGSSSCSPEEAGVVRALVDDLLRGDWVDERGERRPLAPEDVLVVAPFNAHVAELRSRLPDAVPVGTVDKFQGHEGAVVIYSMAASTADDAPRGVSFLYDVHRLNVAVSRARALAVVVASPALLEAPVNAPEQLRAVNALCRFVDEADTV